MPSCGAGCKGSAGDCVRTIRVMDKDVRLRFQFYGDIALCIHLQLHIQTPSHALSTFTDFDLQYMTMMDDFALKKKTKKNMHTCKHAHAAFNMHINPRQVIIRQNWHDKAVGCPLGGAVWESALAVVDQLMMRY